MHIYDFDNTITKKPLRKNGQLHDVFGDKFRVLQLGEFFYHLWRANVKLFIVSFNNSHRIRKALEQILQKMNVLNLFDSIISRDESYDRFEQIQNSLKYISLESSEVLVVGDRIHDVESAKKAGCIPVLKINEIKKNPSFDCKMIENLIEIKKLFD